MSHPEHILAIESKLFQIPENSIQIVPGTIKSKNVIIANRDFLETNEHFRQIIPYCVVKHKGKYGVYSRINTGGESRLFDQHSLGFGGHIDASDCYFSVKNILDFNSTIKMGMMREIIEELNVSNIDIKNVKITRNLILSNKTPVDKVHIGLICEIELYTDSLQIQENEIEWKGFYSIDELKEIENFENWSKIIIENMD